MTLECTPTKIKSSEISNLVTVGFLEKIVLKSKEYQALNIHNNKYTKNI